jgi:hypothetical protein
VLALYCTVKLGTDRFVAKGAMRGMVGAVLEDYGDGQYEVEFADGDGITIALITVAEADLELVVESPDPK